MLKYRKEAASVLLFCAQSRVASSPAILLSAYGEAGSGVIDSVLGIAACGPYAEEDAAKSTRRTSNIEAC